MLSILAEPTFLSLRADAWGALGVWFTGAVTVGLLVYAVRQLKHARLTRDTQALAARELLDEQTRPYLIVDFHFRSIMISVSVKNIGQTPATDVRVALSEKVESAVMATVAWQNSALFTDGVAMLAPGREMRFALDTFPARVANGLPMAMHGNIEYWRFGRRGAKISERFAIDMSGFAEALLPPKDISDIGDEAEKIRKLMEKQQRPTEYNTRPDETRVM